MSCADRLCILPIQRPEIWKIYKEMLASFWVVEEITDADRDREDYKSMSEGEQLFVRSIQGFFATADSLVIQQCIGQFMSHPMACLESQFAFAVQAQQECVHAESYAILLDNLIEDKEEKERLFNAHRTMPAVKKKVDWVRRYMEGDVPFAKKVIGFLCLEAIWFSGAFCCVFWLRTVNKCPGLVTLNNFVSRDEGCHARHAVCIYNSLEDKLSREELLQIITDCVDLEVEFITEAIPCSLLSINGQSMRQYVEFVADGWLHKLGEEALFGSANPFPWMESISLQSKVNFFESVNHEYAKSVNRGDFGLDSDF